MLDNKKPNTNIIVKQRFHYRDMFLYLHSKYQTNVKF